eukprot:TRINITY_DN15798_c0_g1_i1.p1 TRINITY_DN15798_c0_g1~~TRINITY_DN15798_c0_g1_i1.p1  ORF type:complete len:573 (-),score=117.27 TRINITY_DN15798_c0_g1_i1:146-1864(-)
MSSARNRVRVLARFRPQTEDEKLFGKNTCVQIGNNFKSVGVQGQIFSFDRIFDWNSTQQNIYEYSGQPIVSDFLRGYSSAIMVYGQTGAGKTHTMHGKENEAGIVQRALTQIFQEVEAFEHAKKPQFVVSFYEIYLEKIYDLLDTSKQNLRVRSHPTLGTIVEDLTEKAVASSDEAMEILKAGIRNRTTSATKMNVDSSRSHAIFRIGMTMSSEDDTETRCSLLLVDLAGSESGAEGGLALDQQKKINLSLTSLGKVIYSLTEGCRGTSDSLSSPSASAPTLNEEQAVPLTPEQKVDRRLFYVTRIPGSSQPGPLGAQSTPNIASTPRHVPYRDSKLTRVLSDALGGHSRTCLILCASPSLKYESETLSTLRFGQRAKLIKNDCVPQRFNSATNTPTGSNKSMQELYARLDTLQQQLDESQGKERDDENSNLKNSLQLITKERDDLLQENTVIRDALTEKQNNEALHASIDNLCSAKSDVASMSKKYQQQLEIMEEIIDELRLQLQAVLAQRRSRDAEESNTASSIMNEHETALIEAETYKQKVEAMQQRLDVKDRHIAELEEKLKQLELST